ncbi:MAG: hypothetical protein IM337_07430 [Microcystis sp. M110S1]|uniref:hypothetical protein n=1 Tax=Microcystis sp. M110S1 TaxID=2771102 RepID=UPI00258630A5|nr:hypothetical protein [Microcystis sp. M110S1]MCA2973834.1 hypothetical protein [Microcystis sp. M110S1]
MTDKFNLTDEWFYEARTGQERQQRYDTVASNYKALEVLYGLLMRRKEVLARKQMDQKNYDSASWAYHQADLNGQIRQVTELMNLLKFVNE